MQNTIGGIFSKKNLFKNFKIEKIPWSWIGQSKLLLLSRRSGLDQAKWKIRSQVSASRHLWRNSLKYSKQPSVSLQFFMCNFFEGSDRWDSNCRLLLSEMIALTMPICFKQNINFKSYSTRLRSTSNLYTNQPEMLAPQTWAAFVNSVG